MISIRKPGLLLLESLLSKPVSFPRDEDGTFKRHGIFLKTPFHRGLTSREIAKITPERMTSLSWRKTTLLFEKERGGRVRHIDEKGPST